MPIVIYEITAIVRADLIADYEKYMRTRHIPDLLATGYFRRATFARAAETENRYRIIYEARDQIALDDYLRTAAGELRADFARHFPDGVDVSREIWTAAQRWEQAE